MQVRRPGPRLAFAVRAWMLVALAGLVVGGYAGYEVYEQRDGLRPDHQVDTGADAVGNLLVVGDRLVYVTYRFTGEVDHEGITEIRYVEPEALASMPADGGRARVLLSFDGDAQTIPYASLANATHVIVQGRFVDVATGETTAVPWDASFTPVAWDADVVYGQGTTGPLQHRIGGEGPQAVDGLGPGATVLAAAGGSVYAQDGDRLVRVGPDGSAGTRWRGADAAWADLAVVSGGLLLVASQPGDAEAGVTAYDALTLETRWERAFDVPDGAHVRMLRSDGGHWAAAYHVLVPALQDGSRSGVAFGGMDGGLVGTVEREDAGGALASVHAAGFHDGDLLYTEDFEIRRAGIGGLWPPWPWTAAAAAALLVGALATARRPRRGDLVRGPRCGECGRSQAPGADFCLRCGAAAVRRPADGRGDDRPLDKA